MPFHQSIAPSWRIGTRCLVPLAAVALIACGNGSADRVSAPKAGSLRKAVSATASASAKARDQGKDDHQGGEGDDENEGDDEGDGDDNRQAAFPPRAPTADCQPPGCVPIAVDLPVPHGRGLSLSLYTHPQLNDPVARWGDCINEVLRCYLAKSDTPRVLKLCLKQGKSCDHSCLDRVRARIAQTPQAIDAFRAVFLVEGAPCRPGSLP